METEKILSLVAMSIAGLLSLIFLLDLGLKIPFSRSSPVLDVMFIIGGAFLIWQGWDTYREFR